jgi:GMP reductase
VRVETELKLDFDDVLIRPKRSVAPSRASVDLQRSYRFRNASPAAGWTGTPILAANLDTVGTMRMAQALHGLHLLTCLHKYYPLERLIDFFTTDPAGRSTFYTLGIREEDFNKLKRFVKATGDTARLLCVDAANGYTKFFVDRVRQVRELCPWALLLAATWRPRRWCRNS